MGPHRSRTEQFFVALKSGQGDFILKNKKAVMFFSDRKAHNSIRDPFELLRALQNQCKKS